MEELNDNCLKRFDTKFSSNKIACLKIISNHVTPGIQNLLAVYIKFLEIKLCLSRLDNHIQLSDLLHCTETINIPNLIDDLLPYLSNSEQTKLSQIKQTLSQIEQYKSLFSTMQMMQDLFGDGSSDFGKTADYHAALPFSSSYGVQCRPGRRRQQSPPR